MCCHVLTYPPATFDSVLRARTKDGEVATEELELMLKYMGCILRPGEIEKLIKDMFSYATVSWEDCWACKPACINHFLVRRLRHYLISQLTSHLQEWMLFLEKYREVGHLHDILSSGTALGISGVQVDEHYLRAEFAAADDDGNGVLDVHELRDLLNKMGYITEASQLNAC